MAAAAAAVDDADDRVDGMNMVADMEDKASLGAKRPLDVNTNGRKSSLTPIVC